PAEPIFCENETNSKRLFGQKGPVDTRYFKDGFHDFIVGGRKEAVNPQNQGTKAAVVHRLSIGAGSEVRVRLRLVGPESASLRRRLQETHQFEDFDEIMEKRRKEADEFYAELQKDVSDPGQKKLQRQALAGLIWNKQF